MVCNQLIPSDVELPYGSIWRKSNKCLKRTNFASMYAVVVYGVMSHKPPCSGINSIAKFERNNEPTNIIVEESMESEEFLPPLRLKRHVAFPGNCYYCGIKTSESAVKWTLYCCYDCADNN